MIKPVWVWGVPFAAMTLEETVEAVDALIENRRPSYFITANLHYLMLSHENPDLAAINERAAFILADGAPVVWAARKRPTPLPERVAGSDLIFHLCDLSARKGRRLFFLGAPEGVAEEAAEKLRERYPGIQVVGTECPPFRRPTEAEHDQLLARIRAANPDVLFVAFGQPKGERWIFENLERLNVPVCVQVGASLEFAAGRFARAPRWMQKTGLEWVFRLLQEPRRLYSRYARNAWFMGRMIVQDRVRKPGSPRFATTVNSASASPRSARPAVFLDRDDTLIANVPYLTDPAGLRLLPGASEALARLGRAGFALVLVTNQSVVGRGLITEERLREIHDALHRLLAEEGATLDAVYFCPDAPRGDDRTIVETFDRKPGPGMLHRAAADLNLDLDASWMVGDLISDVLAGLNAGCRSILVGSNATLEELPARADRDRVHVAADLAGAAELILDDPSRRLQPREELARS